jgi:hypothetical protein
LRHTREEVVERLVREFEELDSLVDGLSFRDWELTLGRRENLDQWNVKDALAHITFWKANSVRAARKEQREPELRGLSLLDLNQLIFERWNKRKASEVLEWHRKAQGDALETLQAMPDEYFGGRERSSQWPFDLVGHSRDHRVRDIERALRRKS